MQLGANGKNALKKALRSSGKEFSKNVSDMTIAELIEHGTSIGLDVHALVQEANERRAPDQVFAPTVPQASPTVPDSSVDAGQQPQQHQDTETLETKQVIAADPGMVDLAVQNVLSPLGQGDFTTFKAELNSLAENAFRETIVTRTVVRTVEKLVEVSKAPDGCEPIATKRTGVRASAAELFGIGGASAQKLMLDMWDAHDAPAVDPDYVWHPSTYAILTQLKRKRNPFLTGPRGTGKSSYAEQFAAVTKRPFVIIQVTDQTEASMLVGMNGPKGWRDGILTKAIRRPGTVVLVDEISVARPGALFVFQTVLAQRSLYIEETGERVDVADGVVFFAGDNTAGHGDESGDYEGTRRINGATRDRFGVLVQFPYLPADKEASVLVSKVGCSRTVADKLVAFAGLTRQATNQGTLTHGVGIRRLLSWAELLTDGVSSTEAFELAVLWHTAPDDREHIRQLIRTAGI